MKRTNAKRLITGALGLAAWGLLAGCAASGDAGPRLEAEGTYTFWPLAPDEPRVQYVKSFRSGFDLRAPKQSGLEDIIFGEQSEDESAIEKPYGVDIADGRIYVCDIRRPAVTVLDLRKDQIRLIGTTGANRVANPVDVELADDGWLYVADSERRVVLVYGPDERYSDTFSLSGWKPVSLAVHGDNLYVCDLERQKLVIMDRRSGSALREVGGPGEAPGQFRVPIGVDTDRDGFVYVSEMMGYRVQKFTPSGDHLASFGEHGDYAGSFARPKQLAVDSEGIIYVVDAAFQNVQMFNDEFSLLMSFGSAGDFPGAMNLPVGVSVTDEGMEYFKDFFHPGFEPQRLIAVTNQFGPRKVGLYALGRRLEGWTVAQLHKSSAARAGVGQEEGLRPLQATTGDPEPGAGGATPDAPTGAPTGAPEEPVREGGGVE